MRKPSCLPRVFFKIISVFSTMWRPIKAMFLLQENAYTSLNQKDIGFTNTEWDFNIFERRELSFDITYNNVVIWMPSSEEKLSWVGVWAVLLWPHKVVHTSECCDWLTLSSAMFLLYNTVFILFHGKIITFIGSQR